MEINGKRRLGSERSAVEDREGDLTAGARATGDRERNGVWSAGEKEEKCQQNNREIEMHWK